ncbi:MAG: ABC transporter ATP-binding protein [Thermoplasmata archaeon]
MKNNERISIEFKNVSLIYDLYYDKTTTLKEYIVNLIHRRKYVEIKREKLYALKNISMTISHGERVGIIGPNGAGKSTMLKIIAGLLEPSEGEIKIKGNVQPLIEIGAGFNPEFTGRENIYLNGAMLGFTKKEIREKEEEIIEFTELGRFIDIPVKYYSSGMALRLAFTIATIIRPEILIMDEMLSAGDMEFMQKAKERMDKILSSAKILILVSHDLGLIKSLTNRVIVLNKGEILFDGNTDDAIEFYQTMVSHNIEKKQEILRIQEEERRKKEEIKKKTEEELRKQEELRKREEEIARRIIIKDVRIENLSRKGKEIYPHDDVIFFVNFETNVDFDEFYINLHLRNKTNTDIAHFRNDFSGIELKNIKKGSYTGKIKIFDLPFRSNPYRYFFRLVGVLNGEQVIKDSPIYQFEILGALKKDVLIKNEWEIITNG